MRSKHSSSRNALDLGVLAGDGEHPAVGRRDHGGAAEEARHGVAQLDEGAAREHDPDEHAVHLVLALEEGGLALDGRPRGLRRGPRGSDGEVRRESRSATVADVKVCASLQA